MCRCRWIRNLCLWMLPAIVLCVGATPSWGTISFSNNTLTYSSTSDLSTTIDPSGQKDVTNSYGVTKSSFQALNPQIVAFDSAPAASQTLRTLVANYDASHTVTFTFPADMYNYGSVTTSGRGAFSGSNARHAISTVPVQNGSLYDWFDASVTSTGGRGVQSLGFCAAFRSNQAVAAGEVLYTLSDASTETVTLPTLGGSGNPEYVFIGYTAPTGKTITRVQAARTSAPGGGYVSIDDLSFVMSPDTSAPAAVANLATSSPTSSSLTLTWTAPGDDGSTGTATSYDIRYATSTINDSNWASATQVTGEPAPAAAGTNQSMTVSGLNSDTTYYFAMKTADEVPNTSALSNVPSGTTPDSTPPAAITNLATSSPAPDSLTLSWTAPGDDGSTGTAASYDIRYATSTINEGNWASATPVSGEPTPAAAGTSQNMTVSGLSAGTTYYFAIKTADEVPNTSALSNSPSGTTIGGTITFANNTLTYGSPSDLGTTIDPSGQKDVTDSYGMTKASFQALSPQVVAFNGAPAPSQTLRTLVAYYSSTSTVTFTFPTAMYNYGSYSSTGRGAFSGAALQDAISTVPTQPDSLYDWFDATITSTGGQGVRALGFCAAFRNDQAVSAGEMLFTLSDATTESVSLPALGGGGNPEYVFIGYQAPSGKIITRVQASRTSGGGGGWVTVDDLAFVMAPLPDTTAPAAVANLATSSPTASSITLTWTAPGDDGSTGTAASYDIRYASSAIDEGNWASATPVTGEPTPAAAGTVQNMVVGGLSAGTTYYFAIKTSDEVPNTSAISNSPSGTTSSSGGSGTGLQAEYFNNMDLTSLALMRTDATVNFDWGTGSPDASVGADTFSVRWTGQVQAQYTETYTFYTVTDDGVRLWVNNQQLINNWTDHGSTEDSGTITLVAGQRYDIRMEFYENTVGAMAKLLWSSPSTTKQTIPQTQLYLPIGTGTGLRGEYFNNMDLTGLALTRTDATVDFEWGTGSPDASVGADTFSVRWTGQVQPQFTETYTFYTVTDDGVRLWVNNQQLINNWTDHGTTEDSGTISLVAGQRYDITMEYYENAVGAVAKLLWSSSSTPKATIPQSQLYPATGGADTTAPAAVTNLATSNPTSSSITLSWTAPGDDGSTGTAASYDIRYRTGGAVNDSNWASATQVTGEPTPAAAGTNQSMAVGGLSASTTYYFAIKTSDEVPNTSAISNSPSGTTGTPGPSTILALKRDSGLQAGWEDARFAGATVVTSTVQDVLMYVVQQSRWYNGGTASGSSGSGEFAFYKFNLASVPACATINLAQLRIYHNNDNAAPATASMVMTHDWLEGTTNWAFPGASGGLTWWAPIAYNTGIYQNPAGGTSEPYGGWGLNSDSGFDVSVDSGLPVYPSTGGTWGWGPHVWDVTSHVQTWVRNGYPNFGWVLGPRGQNFVFSEGGTDAQPVLFIDYSLTGDATPPATVTNLATSNVTSDSITLSWTAPGDDNSTGTAAAYNIRSSRSPITASNWVLATPVSGVPTPQAAGTGQSMTVSGLPGNTTYYFAMKASDEVPNTSGLSNVVSAQTLVDTVAPAAVSNLATSNLTNHSITLTWTAPGDDNSTGTAASYDIRYSTSTINASNWASATQVTNEPVPAAAGTGQSLLIDNLTQNTTYYFAMKTSDEVPLTSGLSNVASAQTPADTIAPGAVTSLTMTKAKSSALRLTWIASGDDGAERTATSYDVRYRTGGAVTEGNWASATQVTGEPIPTQAGYHHSMWITGLSASTTYYIGIKALDEVSNASTIATVSGTTPALSNLTRPLLQPDDFEYLGAFKLPTYACGQGTGFATAGIAIRRVNGNLQFLAEAGSIATSSIYECNFPGWGADASTWPQATVVHEWGSGIYGNPSCKPDGPVGTAGLNYDPVTSRLYYSYASLYNCAQENIPSLGCAALEGGPTAYGPWLSPNIHTQVIRGGSLIIPDWFANTYVSGRKLGVGFGGGYSGWASCSPGPTLAAAHHPEDSETQLDTISLLQYYQDDIVHWATRDARYYSQGVYNLHNPVGDIGWWISMDSLGGSVWIDLPDKQGLLYLTSRGIGLEWYNDGMECVEGREPWWWIYDPADLADVAQSVKQPWEPQHDSWQMPYFASGCAFDAQTRTLYVVTPHTYLIGVESFPVVHGYHIR